MDKHKKLKKKCTGTIHILNKSIIHTMNMPCCGKSACDKLGTNKCGKCLKELYCCRKCQEDDWKIHKLICPIMKNGDKLLPIDEAKLVIKKFLTASLNIKNSHDKIKILKYALLFVKQQFGDKIEGLPYRIRNCITISNEYVELGILCTLNDYLGMVYFYDKNDISNNIHKYAEIEYSTNKSIYYFEEVLSILKYWQKEHNKLESERIEIINSDTVNKIYIKIGETKEKLGLCYDNIFKFDKALAMYDESISYHSFRKGHLYILLEHKGKCLFHQHRLDEAKIVVSESYNMIIEKYDPTHIDVLRIANLLVTILIELKELYDAERFANVIYESLTKPIDADNLAVAEAASIYARATYCLIKNNGYNNSNLNDVIKIEMLSNKALRIMDGLFGSVYGNKINILTTLYNTFRLKNANLTENAEEVNLMNEINELKVYFAI
jgi:tetratricopeptide (TPR) repeat protein